jgi:hypothetical protein
MLAQGHCTTLADPAMPISPTYVAAGYPLCEPFVNHLYKATHQQGSLQTPWAGCAGPCHVEQPAQASRVGWVAGSRMGCRQQGGGMGRHTTAVDLTSGYGSRVGQNRARTHTPYMTVCAAIFLLAIPHIQRMHVFG